MCKGKAQNRIDYIVLQKPTEASKILEQYGYEPPTEKQELPRAIKLLIRKKGDGVIKELLRIHPERELILQLSGHTTDESNYCGCQSAYTGELKDYLDKLSGMSADELNKLYEEAKQKAKETPGDKTVMGGVEAIWDELKRRKKQTEDDSKKEKEVSQRLLMQLGLAFLAGIIIAKIA